MQLVGTRIIPARGNSSPARQRGMTMIGLVILVIFVGLFVFAGMRLTPVYLNYMKVANVVEGVYEEFDGQDPSAAMLRNSVIRRFSVESVSVIKAQDVKIKPKGRGFEVSADYSHTVPFIGNISFTVHFSKSALIRR